MAPIPAVDETLVLAPFPIPDPVTTPSLTANLVCRVLFSLLAILLCWVPLRLLHKNGEFAASVFVVNTMALNLLTIINALIWRNNNTDEWWAGYGWCDLHPYLYVPMMCLFTSSALAITRNLAAQVGMLRANALSVPERRKKNLVQALIMFPIPIIQMIWMYPITAQRYIIVALVGCDWRVHGSWPYVVFYLLPAPIMAVMSGFYVLLTYKRYRHLRKMTGSALSTNSSATTRQNRTRRRLYFMTLCILIPYIPLSIAHLALNITQTFPLEPFNFHKIHHEAAPFPWNSIVFVPSTQVNFAFMNNKYIPTIASVAIFLFFGITVDAYNTYRRYLLAIGLGRVFPNLKNEIFDSLSHGPRSGTGSWGTRTDTTTKSVTRESAHPVHSSKDSSRGTSVSSTRPHPHPCNHLPDFVVPEGIQEESASPGGEPNTQPAPSTRPSSSSSRHATAADPESLNPTLYRNPFLFRTHLNTPLPLRLPLPSFDFLKRKNKKRDSGAAGRSISEVTLEPVTASRCTTDESATTAAAAGTAATMTAEGNTDNPAHPTTSLAWLPLRERERVSTRVWSDEGLARGHEHGHGHGRGDGQYYYQQHGRSSRPRYHGSSTGSGSSAAQGVTVQTEVAQHSL